MSSPANNNGPARKSMSHLPMPVAVPPPSTLTVHSGAEMLLLDPWPASLNLSDIMMGMSHLTAYHWLSPNLIPLTSRAVALSQVLAGRSVAASNRRPNPQLTLAALLYDVPAVYLGTLTPAARALPDMRSTFDAAERDIRAAVARRFELPAAIWTHPDLLAAIAQTDLGYISVFNVTARASQRSAAETASDAERENEWTTTACFATVKPSAFGYPDDAPQVRHGETVPGGMMSEMMASPTASRVAWATSLEETADALEHTQHAATHLALLSALEEARLRNAMFCPDNQGRVVALAYAPTPSPNSLREPLTRLVSLSAMEVHRGGMEPGSAGENETPKDAVARIESIMAAAEDVSRAAFGVAATLLTGEHAKGIDVELARKDPARALISMQEDEGRSPAPSGNMRVDDGTEVFEVQARSEEELIAKLREAIRRGPSGNRRPDDEAA